MEEFPATPEATIQLPRRHRIMQRLGQITTGATARGDLSARIASHEREMFTPEGFVEMLEGHMHEYAEEHAMGIDVLILNRMPSYIKSILDKDTDRQQALDYWEQKVEAEKGSGSAIDRAVTNGRAQHRPRTFSSQRQSARAAGLGGSGSDFRKPSARRRPWQH